MKVGLLLAFAGRNCGGPEVYEREMVRGMLQLAPQHEYHLFCLDKRAPLVIGHDSRELVYHLLRPSSRVVSMLTTLPWEMYRTRCDIFHSLIMAPPFFPPNAIMSMACSSLICRPELYPPLVRARLRFLQHRAVPKAARIICVSRHVRDVMLETFRLPLERLPVIYPGCSRVFRFIGDEQKRAFLREKYGISYPYFLFSGRWERRKNVLGTLQAFALFKKNFKSEHKLVFTGGKSWHSAEAEEAIFRLGIQNDVADLGKTPFEELPYIYGGAEALIYASLWEGFGMPIVEGMLCGTPVITSNLSAMPEIAGGCALLVNPADTEDIASGMYRIATDEQLRGDLRSRGLKRAERFGWESSSRMTLDLYDEVMDGKMTLTGA
jgi:glycosyltransferase involved in cell wall biosynthesis